MKSYQNNYTDSIGVQVYKLVITYVVKHGIQKRYALTIDELTEWESYAVEAILEKIQNFDTNKGTLVNFVNNYCKNWANIFYLQAKYNFSRTQARNIINNLLKNRNDLVDEMFAIWRPTTVNNTYKVVRNNDVDDECSIYDILPDLNAIDPMEKENIKAIFMDMEDAIENFHASKQTKKLLTWWIYNGFNEDATMKKFNVSRQWVNYNVNKFRNVLRKKWKIRRVS